MREHRDERQIFLSRLPARPVDRRLALAFVGVSALAFAATAPFARTQLPAAWAFIPSYQSALAINDLVTAVLLYGQFATLRSRGLLLLAGAYLFTALMAVAHGLSFPGLFAPEGLLGAGPQTTAWLYMFWHGGLPLLVIGYAASSNGAAGTDEVRGPIARAIASSILAVSAAVAMLVVIATAGHDSLPAIMRGNNYTPAMIVVVSLVWTLSLVALGILALVRPRSVLDVWLMVVMCTWLFDIALAAVLNGGRFDLGFYAGRIYGLLAASFVLVVLLLETSALYAQLARLFAKERQQAAEEISSINAQLRAVLDSSPLPIFSLDEQGRIATWNSAAARVFRHKAENVIGRMFADLPESAKDDYAAMHRSIMAGERLQNVQMHWRVAGRQREVVFFGAPVHRAGRPSGGVFIAEDVTESRKLERQLAQSQKIDALGQLTGGIAHDFNNLLTVITSTIEMLRDGVADRPKLARIAEIIDDAATRGAELTRHLLAFARRQPLQPVETDINRLITDAAKLLRATLGEQIEIDHMLAADAWRAMVDPNQLTSAVINLAINARDAMPGGGKLTIETRNVVLDAAYAKQHPEVTIGPCVMIAVSDTGVGIPAALRDRVFEPFFTTKEVGKGTGLGLSMVFGFVKQSGGHIKVYSEEGHGTTIKMYLPQASDAAAEVVDSAVGTPQGGHEIVLVVEDDAMVRGNVVMQLESLGYRTLVAASGPEALALIKRADRIDLLLTDMVMPGGMSGSQLAEQAKRERPSLKVLFTSGYPDNAMLHQGRIEAGTLLLGKPYRKSDLASMVRKALT